MFSKSEDPAEEDVPKYENYHSSGIYNDIQGESRDISSEEYSDDDYGDLEEDDEEEEIILGSSGEDAEGDTDPLPLAQDDPLPVEKLQRPKRAKKAKKIASVAKFKNGMYRLGVNCTMRAKPSTKAKGVGKARKGKKLWMERHNKNWVKVFKKSGPVYINKLCL